jgi:hypothetical protein
MGSSACSRTDKWSEADMPRFNGAPILREIARFTDVPVEKQKGAMESANLSAHK